jgi:hypothetical protein
VNAAPIDLEVNGIGRTSAFSVRQISTGVVTPFPDGTDVPLEKVAQVGDIAAFTFTTRAKNVGTDPIKWGFPVKELATTPWVVANGRFSGGSEGLNHAHDTILPAAPNPGHNFYGPHPHIQLFLFCQSPGETGLNNLTLLGTSALKHTFSTALRFTQTSGDFETTFNLDADPNPHFFGPGEVDTYSNNSNKDRDFLGPMSEMDFNTFHVSDHRHFSDGNPPVTEDGFNVYVRGHGEKEEAGDPLHFRLQANVNNLDPARQPPGTKWYAAASYFVPDEAVADRANNTAYRQFDPAKIGTDDVWIGATLSGPFLPPREQFVASPLIHPEPSTLTLVGIGTLGLIGYAWRRRKQAGRGRV